MPLTYKQIQTILRDHHFEQHRQTGSHEQRHKNGILATIPYKKEFAIKTAKSILLQISHATNTSYKDLLIQYKIKL